MSSGQPEGTSGGDVAAEDFAARHLKRNLLALGGDFAFYHVAMAFASQSTLLPAFATHLGASKLTIGAIASVMTLGWSLPSLFAAAHTERLVEKLPFVLRWGMVERMPMLVLALAAFFVADRAPTLALGMMLLMLLALTGAGGVLLPAWMDIVGRAVPVGLRGRFFGMSSLVGSVGGAAGSLAIAYILGAIPPPRGFGLCFMIGTAFMALSYAALRLTREPPAVPSGVVVSQRPRWRAMREMLGSRSHMAWFLVARGFSILGGMAAAFYTVYAVEVLRVPAWHVGFFTTALLVGETAGNLTFGSLADRAGHRIVLLLGVLAGVLGNVAALTWPTSYVFVAVFVLLGVQWGAIHVSGLNILLEFAPSAEARPTSIGLGMTLLAPVLFAAPLLGGVVVGQLGFPAVFALAAGFGSVSLLLFLTRVRDPRW